MFPVLKNLRVQPLVQVQECFALIAGWHHQECARQGLTSSLSLRQARLKSHLESQTIPQTLVAFDGDEVVGCVSLIHYRASSSNSSTNGELSPVWLSNLFVRETLRRQGIGEFLINAALMYAKDVGCAELWLSAVDYTDYYQKRGWKIIRQTRLGGRVVNVMKLRF